MESPTYEEEFKTFVEKITKPKTIASLEYNSFKIVYNNEEIVIDDIFNINTVYDLKLSIYEKFGLEDFAAPNNQLILLREPVKDGNEMLDFSWDHTLQNPLFVVSRKEPLLSEFVTNEGTKRIVDIQLYDNMLLEKRLRKSIIHLYFFKDIVSYYNGPQPISEKEYYGRIYPYFPLLRINQTYPSESEKSILQTKYTFFKKKKEYLSKIQVLLKQDTPLIPITFSGLRELKLLFLKNTFENGIESLFFEMEVNEILPYLRLLPVGSTPISKVHLQDEIRNIPSVFDPNLIKSWSDEKSPTPDRDFIIGKISLKTRFTNMPYLYATLQILDDETFKLTIQPPKDIRKLDPIIDFENFIPQLLSGIKVINKNKEIPRLHSTNLIFGLNLSTDITLSKKQFEKRLSLFKPFFQEIPPLPNEQPFMMLRYKVVDNYVTENNINTFLTLLANKKLTKGEATMADAITMISEEFQLDYETARKKVSDWYSQREQLQPVISGESKEFVSYNNSGIDIAIYQKKSVYAIHINNVNNIENLERIISMFRLIFSLDESILSVSQKDIMQLEQAESKVNEIPKESISTTEDADEGDAGSIPDYDDPYMFDGMDAINSAEESTHEDVNKIKEAIAQDYVPADVEVRNTQIKTMTVKQPITEEENEASKEKGLANFFLKKLKEIDSSLFDYTPKDPSEKQYVQMCAANEMRQPSVLTQEQYLAMRDEYKDVTFQVYPLEEGEPDSVDVRSSSEDIVTVLRYGSNPLRQNYYVCSEYFCTRDETIVLKEDFIGTELRRSIKQSDGSTRTTKPRNTCPFCMGKLVTNRKNPGAGETVLQRVTKRNSNKRHVWIDFLKKTTHPEGLKLPCCFLRPSTISFKDTETGFSKKMKKAEKVLEDDDDDEAEEMEMLDSGAPVIDYATTLNRVDKKYIIGLTDKYLPLEIGERDGPQVGVLPKELNELFEQDVSKIIARVGNPQKVLPNATGFLRIAVQNRGNYKSDSFLAAVAPFYFKNSAYQMKKRLDEFFSHPLFSVKLFTNLNYGNMVLEFYDPNYEIKEVFNKEVWADKNLNIDYNENNKEEVERIYKSYYKFKGFLLSDTTTKEYRQFASLFAQRDLLQGIGRPGINFIVIDIKEDNSVHVRCPPFGFNERYMRQNDVAFLLHHYSGTWEPIFYLDNLITGLETRQPYTLTFQYANYASWPAAAKKIYGEYMKSCNSNPTIIYTGQSYINTQSIISVSFAEESLYKVKQKPNMFSYNGILRDPYNHISAIVCSENRSEKRLNVLVPVIDNGILVKLIGKDIYLHPDDIDYESLEDTVRIYNQYILPTFPRYTGYTPMNIVVNKNKTIVGLQLKNLLYIPVKKATTTNVSLPIVEVDEYEWQINKEILFGSDEQFKNIEKKAHEQKEIEEIYQHLRLTFSKWLDSKGSSIKSKLNNDIIFNSTISLNDKRRRLITLFGPLIQNWFSTETNESAYTSLLRKDCTTIESKESCTDRCVFTREGKCKIHILDTYKDINLGKYLMLKLFDEILRYAEKRREIFENEISQLVFLDKAIRIGDQFIVPENTTEWSDFLRFSFTETTYEKPKFFEEFSSTAEDEESDDEDVHLQSLPLGLKSILNPDDIKTKALKYYEITKESSLKPVLDELNIIDNGNINYNDEALFDREMLRKIFKRKKAAIIQINMLTKDFDNTKNITAVGLRNAEIKDIYVIVVMLGSTGFIVKNTNLTLRLDDLPKILEPQQQQQEQPQQATRP